MLLKVEAAGLRRLLKNALPEEPTELGCEDGGAPRIEGGSL